MNPELLARGFVEGDYSHIDPPRRPRMAFIMLAATLGIVAGLGSDPAFEPGVPPFRRERRR